MTLLFDLDGTILDTRDLIFASYRYAFWVGLGERVSEQELLTHFGRPLHEQIKIMRPKLSDDGVHRIAEIYRDHNHREHDKMVRIVPGADRVLGILAARGHRLGIVTSKRLQMTEYGLKRFGLWDLFSVVIHAENTPRHKPHPDPVRLAMEALKSVPDETWMIGDSPYDMASASAAGCHAMGLLYESAFGEESLWRAGAERVVQSWNEIAETFLKTS